MSIFFCTGNKGKLSEFKQLLSEKDCIYGIKEVENCYLDKYSEPVENSNYFLANGFIKIYSALQFVSRHLNKNVINIEVIVADDSGLCVPQLNYQPGADSAVYAGEPRDEMRNRLKLIYELSHSPKSYQYKNELRQHGFFICFLFSVTLNNAFDFAEKINFSDALSVVNKELIALEKNFLSRIDFNQIGGCFSQKIPFSYFCKQLPENVFLQIDCGYCTGEVSTLEQNIIPGVGHGYDSLFYGKKNRELSFASIPLEEKNEQSHRGFAVKAFLSHNK